MDNKDMKNYVETLSKGVVLMGAVGLLVDVFKKAMEEAKVQTAKELEEAMKKLEDK